MVLQLLSAVLLLYSLVPADYQCPSHCNTSVLSIKRKNLNCLGPIRQLHVVSYSIFQVINYQSCPKSKFLLFQARGLVSFAVQSVYRFLAWLNISPAIMFKECLIFFKLQKFTQPLLCCGESHPTYLNRFVFKHQIQFFFKLQTMKIQKIQMVFLLFSGCNSVLCWDNI